MNSSGTFTGEVESGNNLRVLKSSLSCLIREETKTGRFDDSSDSFPSDKDVAIGQTTSSGPEINCTKREIFVERAPDAWIEALIIKHCKDDKPKLNANALWLCSKIFVDVWSSGIRVEIDDLRKSLNILLSENWIKSESCEKSGLISVLITENVSEISENIG